MRHAELAASSTSSGLAGRGASSSTTAPKTRSAELGARRRRARRSRSRGAATGRHTSRASPRPRGDYIVMIDADLTYDFDEIPHFVAASSTSGAEFVMGNRHQGRPAGRDVAHEPHRQPAALRLPQPPLPHAGRRRPLRHARLPQGHPPDARSPVHRDGVRFRDGHSRYAKRRLACAEIPIELHQRGGESKLSPLRDGWRHLRLILVYSPNFLFIAARRRPGRARLAGHADRLLARSSCSAGPGTSTRRSAASLLDDRRHRRSSPSACAPAPTASTCSATAIRGSSGCRAASGSSTVCCSAARSLLAGVALGGVVMVRLARPRASAAPRRRSGWRCSRLTLVVAGFQVFFTSFLLSIIGLRRSDLTPGRRAGRLRSARAPGRLASAKAAPSSQREDRRVRRADARVAEEDDETRPRGRRAHRSRWAGP